MRTPNTPPRFPPTLLPSTPSNVTLADVLVPLNRGKFYVVMYPPTQCRYIVMLVDIGGGHILPVEPSGTIFGGPNPDVWSLFVVTGTMNSFIELTPA